MPITKHNFLVKSVEELIEVVPRAFAIALSGRPGPVLIDIPKDVQTRKVEIAAENHGFAVDMESVKDKVVATHVNLNDQTCEGFQHKTLPAFSVQYHPEASPGPHDADYLFQQFLEAMEEK